MSLYTLAGQCSNNPNCCPCIDGIPPPSQPLSKQIILVNVAKKKKTSKSIRTRATLFPILLG